MPQVARAAVNEGIGWCILNREAPYVPELRRLAKAPVFTITSDHVEIGRIQGHQFAALLPQGGAVLYIQGPSENSAAKERTAGMMQTKPANIHVTLLRAQWTEDSAQRSVRSWLKLTTSQRAAIDVVGAQDDSMAIGARNAFQELESESDRDRWLRLPYTGCDGLPKTGQAWVKNGTLAATIFVPPNAGQAMEMLVGAIQERKPVPERALIDPVSIPPVADLRPRRA